MKFLKIEKISEGKFITRYNVFYETSDKKTKVYEMISRDHNMTTYDALANHPAEAVVIIATNEAGDKLLLNKEFRLAIGDWIYNFPAGLIDPGEDASIAAKREIWEETGLDLYQIDETYANSFSAIGFSNESNITVIGKAKGEFRASTSTAEEIEAGWYSPEEVLSLIKTEKFAARTQAFCYLWGKYNSKN